MTAHLQIVERDGDVRGRIAAMLRAYAEAVEAGTFDDPWGLALVLRTAAGPTVAWVGLADWQEARDCGSIIQDRVIAETTGADWHAVLIEREQTRERARRAIEDERSAHQRARPWPCACGLFRARTARGLAMHVARKRWGRHAPLPREDGEADAPPGPRLAALDG